MFFQGGLQEGISTAIQQSKQVVCFVTDDGTESQQWEDEFLTDTSVETGLKDKSVVLRLQAGSQEASYLEALFPIPKKPTVVVIHNGQLKEYIAAGTGKEDFLKRLSGTFQSTSNTSQPRPASVPVAPSATQPSPSSHALGADSSSDQTQSIAPPSHSSVPIQNSQPSPVEEARLSAEQKGKGRADAEPETRRRAKSPERDHANEIKLKKQQANEERQRILKRIEDDKRARKEREAEERRARQFLASDAKADDGSHQTTSIPLSRRTPKAGQGDHCNLQVRLLDGSTIRTRFPSDKTLNQDVRKWIDEERTDGDAPYSFRIVLTPLPNKVIAPEEELKSLLSLGLTPSATLVLIPTRHSVAYAHAGGVLTPLVGVFSSLYGAIMRSLGGIFSMFFGGGHVPPPNRDDIPMENVRARRRDNQLYNGNSLNFEPRNDEEDDQ
ncbi:hypothetical protein GGS20DRAFT_561914 [Poronia punctata]|nr:hypothetical protein GGS20DRAFT_561914 [Poronia punctata]